MRKSTSYFVRKMEVMQKLTTMAWVKENIGRKKGARNTHYARNYFRYESNDEIMEKFTNGGILSGLIIKDNEGATVPHHVWCVYGKKVCH